MNFLKRKSVIYVLREVTLIFIGITIALWFNNWNESKKARQAEIKTLIEINKALAQDLNDIKTNMNSYRGKVLFYELLLGEIEDNQTMSDDAKKRMVYAEGFATFISNIGPYETLKSRGLEKISNDNIRLEISSLYDVKYEGIKSIETVLHEHYFNYIKPNIINFFDVYNMSKPFYYSTLKNEKGFIKNIQWDIKINNTMLGRTKQIVVDCEALMHKIKEEIKRLEEI